MKSRDNHQKPVTGRVILTSGGRTWEGRTRELTVSWCRVETGYTLDPGQNVQLRMHVTGHPSVSIDVGIVRWAAEGEAGIEFLRMTEDERLRLRGYVGSVMRSHLHDSDMARLSEDN